MNWARKKRRKKFEKEIEEEKSFRWVGEGREQENVLREEWKCGCWIEVWRLIEKSWVRPEKLLWKLSYLIFNAQKVSI